MLLSRSLTPAQGARGWTRNQDGFSLGDAEAADAVLLLLADYITRFFLTFISGSLDLSIIDMRGWV